MANYRKTKLACYIGYVVQAIINNFLPILFVIFRKEYNLSYEQLGRILFANFAIQLLADTVTPYIVKKIGYKGAVLLCHLLASFGLIMVGTLPLVTQNKYLTIIISVMVYAFGSGIIEVVVSPMMELLPTKRKAANMAFLHSFYCWGQLFTVLVTTALVALFGRDKWYLIPIIWSVVPIMNFILFLFAPVIEPDDNSKESKNKFIFSREFVCFMIFMICAGASEITMAQWASYFAETSLGISKVAGDILGPCAFAVLMGVGRVVYGAFSGKYSIRRALIFNNILCFVCYIVVAFCKIPAFSLIACALCGFSVSLSWPGTYSLAAARFPSGGTLMFSLFALGGDTGCSIGPWLFGFIADRAEFKTGFLVTAIFPIIMVLTALFLMKEKDCKTA